MGPRDLPGPARRAALPWAILLVGLLPAFGCERPDPGPELDPELVAELGLDGTETVHRVLLGGARTDEHVTPLVVEAAPGDLVEFVTVDRRVHAVSFETDSLHSAATEFLGRTRQVSSPPLVGQGSRFVVTFKNAPPGRYPFTSSGYGEPSGGVIIVRQDGQDR